MQQRLAHRLEQIKGITVSAFKVPCDAKESDGTLEWSSTTMVLVVLKAGGHEGIGYTYSHKASLSIIEDIFFPLLKGAHVFDHLFLWDKMVQAVRNNGLSGLVANAISAVDTALWDLKAKILEIPLCQLFGMARENMPVYGSGGFTSYTDEQIAQQFLKWQALGIKQFKMKVGRDPSLDLNRVKNAKNVIGPQARLMVDANGAYSCKQALEFAEKFAEVGVNWFEEPISSDDLEGLHLIRNRAPTGMKIAAGEYGYDLFYFRRMLEAQAIDILQADATRCLGYTGFIHAAYTARAFNIPVSSHTSPSLHLPVCLSLSNVCHMEYFHDHVRIEELFFDGFPKLQKGHLYPHLDRTGHGLILKKSEAKQYLINEASV